ncbi:MAG: FHA domain-containing protein [Anaerolineae bacterium]
MLRCSSCGATHLNNTLFCDQCGMWLQEAASAYGTSEVGQRTRFPQTPVRAAARPKNPAQLVLSISGDEVVLPLPLQKKWVLGRGEVARGHAPDVDLDPYRAYDMGVSRQHAVLWQEGDSFCLEDLSSRNGTFVNGRRLDPFQAEPVDHGDEVRLGTLSFLLLLR